MSAASHPVKGIDHCFALVNDLDDSVRRYEALGFTLSPRGLHSVSKGTANHTIMFPDDYFELLGVLQATELNAMRRTMLAEKGEGLHAIACRIDDAAAAAEALGERGIATEGLGSFSRPVPLPGGGTGEAAFSTVAFTADEVPRGMVFMCQHKTPETVWLPELLNHPNTASGLAAILTVADDPAGDAAGFARLWAAGAVSEADGIFTVATGANSADLLVMAPERMAALYPGIDLSGTAKGAFTAMRLKVGDIGAAAGCLAATGVTAHQTALGIAVDPADACGLVVEFAAP
ncbi:hypothetical protein ATO13_12886 [Stappia sp. 22II-S9-Z10]|nr:hypothetical protein ATO13_12886 [Stappia sp. 22II-S9-Z10]